MLSFSVRDIVGVCASFSVSVSLYFSLRDSGSGNVGVTGMVGNIISISVRVRRSVIVPLVVAL